MGLGSTAKKIQTLAERAEQLYSQILELREQMAELRETVEATGTLTRELDRRSQQQWAIIQAIAEAEGIDVDAVLTEAAIEEVVVEVPGEADAIEDDEPDDDPDAS